MANDLDTRAYWEGYKAREQANAYANPYAYDEPEYQDYSEGWEDADLDMTDGE